MSRKTPISKTMRRALVEMADSAAYSKRIYKLDSDSDFHRIRWVVLQNTIENILYTVLSWPRDEANHYAVALVLTREHHQNTACPLLAAGTTP